MHVNILFLGALIKFKLHAIRKLIERVVWQQSFVIKGES
jgi:hypothetical protein